MSSLVISLQEEALSPDVPVTRLLAKAKVIAAKLGLTATTEWIAAELGGYGDAAQVPDYRMIYGGFVARNPLYGWQTIQISNAELAETFEKRPAKIPVSQMEALLSSAEGGKQDVMISISAGLANQLRESLRIPYEIMYSANSSQLARILDAVRQRVLDWALKLESDGILGDGLLFSQEEKKRVSKEGDIYNIHAQTVVASLGPVSDRATVNVTQTIQGVDLGQLRALLEGLRQTLGDTAFKGREDVEESLAKLDAEAASGEPRKNVVLQYLETARGFLGNATSFAGKEAALHLVDHFVDLFPV
jgi:hypothetical protein